MCAAPDPVAGSLSHDDLAAVLSGGDIDLGGRLVDASNATFVGEARLDGVEVTCVYKPVRGERPLWDFPSGTLAGREVATYVVSVLAGLDVVPVTVLGDGPFGPGMVQAWVTEDERSLVDVVPRGPVEPGWRHVVDAYGAHDEPVALVHADDPHLRRMALLDVVVNNADRKGGHVLPTGSDAGLPTVRGCDHGLTFHVEPKLRTVLWGWAGEPLDDDEVELLDRLAGRLVEGETVARLVELVSEDEIQTAALRAERLAHRRRWPGPSTRGPAIPWPAF